MRTLQAVFNIDVNLLAALGPGYIQLKLTYKSLRQPGSVMSSGGEHLRGLFCQPEQSQSNPLGEQHSLSPGTCLAKNRRQEGGGVGGREREKERERGGESEGA